MKNVAIILVDGFEEIEAISILDILRRADINTVAVIHRWEVLSLNRGGFARDPRAENNPNKHAMGQKLDRKTAKIKDIAVVFRQ